MSYFEIDVFLFFLFRVCAMFKFVCLFSDNRTTIVRCEKNCAKRDEIFGCIFRDGAVAVVLLLLLL